MPAEQESHRLDQLPTPERQAKREAALNEALSAIEADLDANGGKQIEVGLTEDGMLVSVTVGSPEQGHDLRVHYGSIDEIADGASTLQEAHIPYDDAGMDMNGGGQVQIEGGPTISFTDRYIVSDDYDVPNSEFWPDGVGGEASDIISLSKLARMMEEAEAAKAHEQPVDDARSSSNRFLRFFGR